MKKKGSRGVEPVNGFSFQKKRHTTNHGKFHEETTYKSCNILISKITVLLY